jgi:hypothetical protein
VVGVKFVGLTDKLSSHVARKPTQPARPHTRVTPTIAEPTHVAAMIYYRKTLFGRWPKLTPVHSKAEGIGF